MSNIWTEDRVELIKTLWHGGSSASEISRELGNGYSRNAVIGKLHRLRITREGMGNVRQTHPKISKPVQKKPFVPRIVDAAPPPIGPENDFPAAGFCRFIVEHPAIQPWRCCGHPVHSKIVKGLKVDFAFCEPHWVLVYQPKLPPAPVEANNYEPIPMDEKQGSVPFANFKKNHNLHGKGRNAA